MAWTSAAFLAGQKTVTRRDWKDAYAQGFRAGEVVQVYDTLPRCRGKRIGFIRLLQAPYKQWLHEVNDEDERKEGGLWGSGKAYQEAQGEDREMWVIEFERV